MEITGKVIRIEALEQGISNATGQPWEKQTIVVELGGRYPQAVAVSFMTGRIPRPLPMMGDEVTVSFDISSREYNARWYTELLGWKLEPARR